MTREEAIKFLKAWNPIHPLKQEARDIAVEALKQPKIVRCKDCKHCYVDGENVRYNVCELDHNKVQSDNWFCADGERKEGRVHDKR